MGMLRDASPAKGQAVKPTTNTANSIGATRSAGCDGRGHVKGPVPKTLATRKPRRWGGKS